MGRRHADDDGGLSLISAGWRAVTTADKKQEQLENQINEVHNRLLQLARGWVVDPDANVDREKRNRGREGGRLATANPQAVYYRVQALRESLSFDEGDEWRWPTARRSPRGRRRPADPLDPASPSAAGVLARMGHACAVPNAGSSTPRRTRRAGRGSVADDLTTLPATSATTC